jgi:outer membrane protein assembly factor BamB
VQLQGVHRRQGNAGSSDDAEAGESLIGGPEEADGGELQTQAAHGRCLRNFFEPARSLGHLTGLAQSTIMPFMCKSTTRAVSICIAVCALFSCYRARTARANDWPHWRGPDYNGISNETGWQAHWPAEGPKRLWKASVGTGFSSITVSEGRAYTMGNLNDTDWVYCFDAETGTTIWKYSYASKLDPHYYEGGTSSTPTVDGDRVYTLSKSGDLHCLNARTGKVVWNKNVHDETGAGVPTWGFASSALIDGDLLVLNIGDAGAAFDKSTGKTVWKSGTNPGGYATPVPFGLGKDRCVAISGWRTLEVVRIADGKTVWSFPWKTQYDINASDPIIVGDLVHISSGCGHGNALLKVTDDKPSVLWENKELQTHIASCIFWHGCVYGIHDNTTGSELQCLDWATGKVKWANADFGKGTIMLADGRLIGLSDKGELMVIEPDPSAFKVISRAQVLGGKCWTVPTLANGRIYCRNAKGDVVCLDVRAS